MTEINNNSEEVLFMILYMQKTYIEYFEQANKADKQYDKIQI